MKPIDIKDLVNGLITLVLLALAIGQYDNLRAFAKREFLRSMKVQTNSFQRPQVSTKGVTHE